MSSAERALTILCLVAAALALAAFLWWFLTGMTS